jgi:hypothetical protein
MNIQAILADKWVRISGGILAVVFAITFLPLLIGYQPDGGLVFFNIVLALVFFNVVVQRHPIMSLRWLYGIDLGLGVLLLLATLPAFSESAVAGITALILIPLNFWTGYQFIKEMGRKASLQGRFLPAHESGLTLEFTNDGNLILSNGKVYRYTTRRNDLLLYDGDTLATKWEIAKCDMKNLLVKDDQGNLHEYKRDFTAVKSAASTVASGLGAAWGALGKFQDTNRLRAKWTPQEGRVPSIEFTEDGAFVSSDGKAGKYTVDWNAKAISVTLTDNTPLMFQIVSLSPTQLVLSDNGVATTYTTTMGKRLGMGGASGQQQQTRSPEFEVLWEIPATDKRPAFTVTSETSRLEFENWSYDPSSDRLNTVFSPCKTSKDHNFHVLFFDSAGVQVDEDNFYTSSTLMKGHKYEGSVLLSRIARHKQLARVVIRNR